MSGSDTSEAEPNSLRYVAGCGRSFVAGADAVGPAPRRDRSGREGSSGASQGAPSRLDAYAYTELAYPECPTCPHRVEPDDGPAFCVWRRDDLRRPFAALEGLLDGDGA